MAAGTFNLTGDYVIEAGDTYDIVIQLNDPGGAPLVFDETATSGPARAAARMKFRLTADTTGLDILAGLAVPITMAVIIDANADLGDVGIVLDSGSVAGQVRIVLDAVTTAALSITLASGLPTATRSGVYDLEVYKAGIAPQGAWRVLQGAFTVDPEVTR